MAARGFTVKKDWDNPVEHAMPAEARVPAEVRLGAVVVRPATVLAPMAGVTDTVFRQIHPARESRSAENRDQRTENRRGRDQGSERSAAEQIETAISNVESGCGLLMTEFTSADGLARMRETKRRRYLTFYDDEHPIGAQLFGSNPETLAEAARIVEETGFDTVDLNLGCPAKRVVGCNGGSGLLRDLPKIGEIFHGHSQGGDDSLHREVPHGLERIADCVRGAGADGRGRRAERPCAACADARTGLQRAGAVAMDCAVKQAVKIPVIGNGDVRTPEDAAAMVAETGCDAVMIGRAAPANPWIFRQIAQYTATGSYERPTIEDRYRMIRAYFEMLLAEAEATKDLPRDARMGDPGAR